MYPSKTNANEFINNQLISWNSTAIIFSLLVGIIGGTMLYKLSYIYFLGLLGLLSIVVLLLTGHRALLLLGLALLIPAFPQLAKPVMNRYIHWYEILFLLMAILTIARIWLDIRKVHWELSLLIPTLLYLMMIFISALNSLDFKGAVYLAMTPIMVFIILYHLVLQTEHRYLMKPFLTCYLLGVTYMGLVGLAQYFFNDYLFYDDMYLRIYGSRFLEAGISKISSTMINSVHYGPFITIAASLIFALLFSRTAWYVRLGLLMLFILIVFNIMLVNSRTTTLMLVCSLGIVLLFKRHFFTKPRHIILLLLALSLAGIFIPSWVKDRFKPFVNYLKPESKIVETIEHQEIRRYDISSNEYRLTRMRLGWEYFLDHPWIGAGILQRLNPHHDLLQILACHGILGLMFFLWIMASIGKKLYLAIQVEKDDLIHHIFIGVFAAFISLCLLGVFNNAMEFLPNFFYILFFVRVAPFTPAARMPAAIH